MTLSDLILLINQSPYHAEYIKDKTVGCKTMIRCKIMFSLQLFT